VNAVAAEIAVAAAWGWVRHLAGPARRLSTVWGSVSLALLGRTSVAFIISKGVPVDPAIVIVGDKATRGSRSCSAGSASAEI
jgi:hypothetical protein